MKQSAAGPGAPRYPQEIKLLRFNFLTPQFPITPRDGTRRPARTALAFLVSTALVAATTLSGTSTAAFAQAAPAPLPVVQTPSAAPASAAQLDQLVAPIALYPDALVAQVLAASTYPTEVVEADRWLQQHQGLTGDALAQAVNQQSWDPSVKALIQFPSVLANMDQNLPWTTALGTAYAQQQQGVLDAVQAMRQRAQQAGTLKACPQETVLTQGSAIVIQPVEPTAVYVPQYNPWLVYGAPIPVYPGWVGVPGIYVDGPEVIFGAAIGLAAFAAFGWGWHHWGADWGGHSVFFDNRPYVSHGSAFAGHAGGFAPRPAVAHTEAAHAATGRAGFAAHRAAAGHAGFAGRGGFHPAAGGFHGGGFHGGFAGGGFHGGGFHGGGFHGGGGHGGGGHERR